MNITNKYGPNTTILLPGSCNAHCEFCFWNRKEAKIKPPADYFDSVFSALLFLPDDFKCLSISGGEPTLSPFFGQFLARLGAFRRRRPFDRVVLTTHGGNLAPFLFAVGSVVDHINISRHGIGDAANYEIFGTENIPSDDELRALITDIHCVTNCDVTLNCVIPDDSRDRTHAVRDFCSRFIKYAKDLGADAVSFRKEASTVAPTKAERAFRNRYGVVNETKCPVCRGMNQDVNGFDVRWKGTVHEPSIETGGVYEAVIHPDGKVYTDWGMKVPLDLSPSKTRSSGINSPWDVLKEERKGSGTRPISVARLAKSVWESFPGNSFDRVALSSTGCGNSGCGGNGSSKGGCGGGGSC